MTQSEFDKWKDQNKTLVDYWIRYALARIKQGYTNLRAPQITEHCRDVIPEWKVFNKGTFKIPNECNTWLPRYFIWLHPEHEDKFKFTKSFRYVKPLHPGCSNDVMTTPLDCSMEIKRF